MAIAHGISSTYELDQHILRHDELDTFADSVNEVNKRKKDRLRTLGLLSYLSILKFLKENVS